MKTLIISVFPSPFTSLNNTFFWSEITLTGRFIRVFSKDNGINILFENEILFNKNGLNLIELNKQAKYFKEK